MVDVEMAEYVIGKITGMTDPDQTCNALYRAVCEYVESHAEVFYSWAGTFSGAPDPVTLIDATIKTAGEFRPVETDTPETTQAALNGVWNANAATWMVMWPPGFVLSTTMIIPSISFKFSYATEQLPAVTSFCSDIIQGIKNATPVATGIHGTFTGAASFIKII